VINNKTLSFGLIIADVYVFGLIKSGRSYIYRGTFIEKMACLILEGIAEFGKQLINFKDLETAVKLSFKDETIV
jgi:hypothetical protein